MTAEGTVMSKTIMPPAFQKDQQRANIPTSGASLWEKLLFYARFTWRFVIMQRPEALIYGIALTDRCNFRCRGCHVSNTGRPDMTWDQVAGAMRNAWDHGFRELYFSGGEPMLWRDGEHTLEEAIV